MTTFCDDPVPWQSRAQYVMKELSSDVLRTPKAALYVVCTSGSTGKPKGIVISHRAFISMTPPYSRLIGIGPETRGFCFSSYAFDIGIGTIDTIHLIVDIVIIGNVIAKPHFIDYY
ncbi:acetyl-CoA synthetase-like protein [Penicillium angulare]|uniref:Acetyl-CoA synthetase-like protein n=1 Tax=Penicillium angulare TaxID=116970 RepID=A0A9W9FZP8_9EURO|nr:acetyl-CoA synthetase-like protein [Penicillium angulare]